MFFVWPALIYLKRSLKDAWIDYKQGLADIQWGVIFNNYKVLDSIGTLPSDLNLFEDKI